MFLEYLFVGSEFFRERFKLFIVRKIYIENSKFICLSNWIT
jgi:hypothetical protein